MLWLSAMEPEEAACVMTAMRDTFPVLRGNRQWAAELERQLSRRLVTQLQQPHCFQLEVFAEPLPRSHPTPPHG
jgi:uncharacterized lipoprotein YmbA